MIKSSRIFVNGHSGMVGSAIVRLLKKEGYENIITASTKELDMRRQSDVEEFYLTHRPEFVFIAAAKVGGIFANNEFRADFFYDNMMIAANLIHSSYKFGAKKVLFLGSSCVYPKLCPQPIKEEYLLSGPLEQTNEPYAIAKIAGIKMIESYNRQYQTDYISCMPTNLYGLNDNYHPKNSHVLPALIRKFVEAKIRGDDEVMIWGDGSPKREFLFVDDLAEACLYLINNYSSNETINVGSGLEVTIGELANTIKEVVNYAGNINFDTKMPNGTPRKFLDSSKINQLGWRSKTSFKDGIAIAVQDFCLKEKVNLK